MRREPLDRLTAEELSRLRAEAEQRPRLRAGLDHSVPLELGVTNDAREVGVSWPRQSGKNEVADAIMEAIGPRLQATADELAGWREHAEVDCAALRRVWALTRQWEAGAVGPSLTANMYRDLAAEVRAAVTADG